MMGRGGVRAASPVRLARKGRVLGDTTIVNTAAACRKPSRLTALARRNDVPRHSNEAAVEVRLNQDQPSWAVGDRLLGCVAAIRRMHPGRPRGGRR